MTARPSRLVLLGHPVGHSLSPLFQNAALRAAALPIEYALCDVEGAALAQTLEGFREANVWGNVTIPHKRRVAELCDVLTDSAKRAGAVNTFWFERGKLHGDNTDITGVIAALQHLSPNGLRDKACAVLGAGGSAAAVLIALATEGASEIRMWARTASQAHTLIAQTGVTAHVFHSAEAAARECAVVVNATSIGLADENVPLDVAVLADRTAVLDLVYRRGETAFVRMARARGLAAADGLRMLVEQGAASFERWFGFPPDRDVMWRALDGVR